MCGMVFWFNSKMSLYLAHTVHTELENKQELDFLLPKLGPH